MFRLWSLAEQDLLSENASYRLRDTGQGLNRIQAAPKTSRMMHAILNRAQKSIGSWVGSSVIHMGDHNVPNALMFIGEQHIRIRHRRQLTSPANKTNTRKSTASSFPSATPSNTCPSSPRVTQLSGHTSTTSSVAWITAARRSSPISSAMDLMDQARATTSTLVRVSMADSPVRGIGVRTWRRSVSSPSSCYPVSRVRVRVKGVVADDRQ